MNSNDKSENAYKTIGEVTKELGLIDKKTGRLQTHTIRYWETQFKKINQILEQAKEDITQLKFLKLLNILNFY